MGMTGKELLENYKKRRQGNNVSSEETTKTTGTQLTGSQLLENYKRKKKGVPAQTEEETTESAWDKYKEFANSEEASQGWQKYLADQEASKQADVDEEEDEKWWEKIGRWLGSGGVGDTSLPMGTATQTIHSIRDTGLPDHTTPEADWDDEQRNIFGYLYSTNPDMASQYAEYLNTEAKEKEAIQNIQDSATSNFWAGAGHTVGAIATAPLGLADFLNDLVLANAGVSNTQYDGDVSPFEYSQAVTEGISTHLNEKGGTIGESVPIIGGKGWGDLYGLGTSIAQSAASAYTLGSIGTLVSYFGQGAASGVDDALSRGASEEQAVIYGTILGVAEGLAEQIGIDNLFKLGASPTLKVAIKNILKQAGAEGLEEGLTSIISNIADNAIMQDQSNFNAMVKAYMEQGMTEAKAKQMAWMDSIEGIAFDALAGAVSGSIHAGVHTGVKSAIDNHKVSQQYGDTKSIQDLLVDAVNTGGEAGNVADKLLAKYEKKGKLSGANLNELLYTTDTTKMKLDIEAKLTEHGETGDISAIADVLVRQAAGEELSSKDWNTLNNSKAGHKVSAQLNKKNIKSGALNDDWATYIGTRRLNPEAYNRGAYELAKIASGYKENIAKASVAQELAESGGASEAKVEVSDNGKNMYYDAETDSYLDADIKSIVSTKGGIKVELENGKTVSASDLRFATREEGVVYEMLARMDVTPETANEIISTFKPSNEKQASLYYDSIPLAYRMGLMGNEQGLKYIKLTDAQKRIVYNRGRIDAVTNAKERDSARATSPKNAKTNASLEKSGIIFEDGLVYDETTSNDLQKMGIAGAEAIAKTTNLEVHVFASKEENGKRVAYVNGKLVSAPNGYFTNGNKIYIDVNAGMLAEGAMLYALSHEVTHYIRKWNAQGFKDLADFLIAEYGKHGVDVTGLIARQKEKIKKRYQEEKKQLPNEAKLFDMAYEELVADAMSDMFADPNAYKKLAKFKKKNYKAWKKLGEVIKQVLDKLKNALNVYRGKSPVAQEAFHVRDFSVEAYNKLQDLYIKAFVEADANYEASLLAMEESTDAVAVEDTTMYSYSSLAFAAGFTPQENEDGSRAFIRDGKAVSRVTVEDIENSPIGAFINYSLDKKDITKVQADQQKKMFAEICTMACKTNDFSMTMQFVGSAVFTGMKANADKQYGTTYDFPSICTKTQAVIDAMSARMVKLGRGLNSDEIVKLYRDVFASGNPVPCPECYVFSRWIGIGGLLDNIKKYQDYYGGMSVSDVSEAYKKMHAEVEAFAEEQEISFGKAKGALTSKLTKEYNKLTEKIEKATNQGETVKDADRKRLAELEPMMNTVKAMTWLENVYFADSSLTKVNKNYKVPNEVLFDLNNGEAFATQYPEAWAFRTTQGAGYGKAITPYAEANLGEGILVTNNTTNAIKGKSKGTLNNYFLQQKGKMDANTRKALDSARAKQKNQAFLGGQRFQSTSDARYENASDYLLAALEMQAMRGRTQVYTKVDGAVPAFATWGFSINQSLMPLGGGFDADGNIKDTSVGGMNPKVAFENRKKFETAGTITIGVNDKHIRTLVKSVNRDFVIPYHASGGKADIVAEFRTIQDIDAKRNAKVRSTDYSRTQSDKILSDDVLRWLGKTDAEIEQIHKVREARIGILTRGKVDMDVVRGNRFLSELYDKFHGGEWDGVKLAKGKVESQIYPNEFWDQTITYEESSKITKDYLEYCDDLGFLHRFSGLVPSNGKLVPVNGYDENGNRVKLTDLAYKYEDGQKTDEVEDYFWKVLTDRRMYDNNGNYLPQKIVTLNDTTTDTVTTFAKHNEGRQYDKAKSLKTATEIAETKYSDRVLMGSLFSGGGTLEAGLVYQMLDKEFAVEYNKQIASTYTDNHGKEHMFVGDVREFNSKEKQSVFYLHASPVCKNYSAASHSGGETTLDITTAQATARVLEEQMPQVFTVENVKRYIGSEAYNLITNKLDELGYTWDVAVYKASDYGNATKRERMIIRAVKDGQLPPKPQKVSSITSWGEATKDLWKTDLIPSNLVKSKIEAIKNTPELKNLRLTKLDKPLLIYDTTKSKQINYAWVDELAPTLTTKCGDARIIMPDGRVYAPTPKFMGRIQGLPDDYKYPSAKTNAFKIIGNGIPTQLTKAVIGGVLDSAYEQTHNGEVLYSDRDSATEVSDFVSHLNNIVQNRGEWYVDDVFEYIKDHPTLNFIERIYAQDKSVRSDLKEYLDGIDDNRDLFYLSWFLGEAYAQKAPRWGENGNMVYPYRGAIRTFRNAVKKRENDIMTAKVNGTNLGIKNGEVSLNEVKDLFYRLNSNEEIGEFANKVFATAEKLGVNIRFANQVFSSKKVAGDNLGDMIEYKTSYFNDTARSNQKKASVILHELIHACTVYVMSANPYTGDISYPGKSPNYNMLANAATRLNRIYEEIANDPDFKGMYGIKNAKEMVAELSNEDFVAKLKQKNLWERIVDWICNLFGIQPKTSAYENARMCIDYILDNPDISEYKSFVTEQRMAAHRERKDAFGKTVLDDGQVRYSDRDNIGYHAGDLGKAEFLHQQGYSRGTGHFGTGTYFVGDEERISGDNSYGKRPHHAVDFSNYNLYKVKDDKDGYELHEQLRVIDGGISQEWITAAENDQFSFVGMTDVYDLAEKRFGEDKYSDEAMESAILELAEKHGIELLSREEYSEEYGISLDDEDFAFYYLGDYLTDTFRKESERINSYYKEFRNAYFSLKLRFGFGDKVLKALKAVLEYQNANADTRFYGDKKDSLATVFMKSLGYEGIDVRGTSLDNVQYGSVIYDLQEDTIIYSDRDTDSVSNRTLLANALESVAEAGKDRNLLRNYKTKVRLIESEQAKLAEIKAKANEIRFTKGRTSAETKTMNALDAEAKQIESRINTYDKELLKLEAMSPIKKVLEREKTKLRKRIEQQGKEALNAQRTKNAETVREIMNRNTESRKKAVEGRHKTEMRRDIKKLLQRLNKLFKGGKERNVKEGMKEAVSTALALGDVLLSNEISNLDIVNLGVESVTEKESKLLNEYRDLLMKKQSNLDKIGTLRAGVDVDNKEQTYAYISELEAQNRKYDRRMSELNGLLSDVFVRERARLNRMPVNTLIDELASEYQKLKSSEYDYIRNAYDPNLYEKLVALKDKLGGVVARDMSMSQLEQVKKVFTMLEHSIRTANQAFRNGKWEDLQQSASAVMEEIEPLPNIKQEGSSAGSELRSFLWNELTPFYAFDKIGSKTLMAYFKDLMKGQAIAARDAEEAKAFAQATREKHNYSKWKLDEIYEFQLNDGRTFRTTLKHLLSVYAYSKREQADLHMSIGGFFHNDKATFRKEKGILKMVRTDAVGYKVDANVLAQIENALGKEKTSYVDDMLGYLTKMGEKGNEVTRIMWGVDIFTEKVYFPLKSKDDFLKKSTETAQAVSLKNDGMTKETVPGANNPIVLEAFDDVWANHVERMSVYHGFVIPIDNLNKVIHYGTWVGTDAMSVSTMLEGKFTSAATDYIEQLINDLNGGAVIKGATNPFMSFFGKFKKTAVGASLSTIVQQPTAIIRAMAEIDAKYFVGKPNLSKLSEQVKELQTYAPIAIIKEIGGFDAGGGSSIARWINSDTLTGIDKVMNTIDDVSMKGAEVADWIGWTTIWEAIKRETKETTNLNFGSKEFLDKCGERFEEIIMKTQVYDSTLSRSGFMRSKNDGVKMITSFMGEPTLSINMIYNAVLNAIRGGKEAKIKAVKTIGCVYVAIILAEALSSAIYALRDDDEDESYVEKYLQSFGSGMVSDVVLAPITSLPGVKDIVSIFQGWDIERSDMAIFKDIKDAFDGLDSENKSAYRKVEDFAGAIAAAFGVPLKNVLRTGREVYNAGSHVFDDVSGGSAWDAFAEGITGKSDSNQDRLYKAMVSGDRAQINRIKGNYATEQAFESAVKQVLRDNDSRIHEAAQARLDGDIAKYTRIAREIIREGNFSQDIVVGAVNAEMNAIKRGETTAEEPTEGKNEITSLYSGSDVNSAFDNGDFALGKQIISDLIETKVANGMEQNNAKSSLRSSMTSYWKPLYKEAYQSGDTNEMARIRQILYASGLYGSVNEVVKTTQSWLKS